MQRIKNAMQRRKKCNTMSATIWSWSEIQCSDRCTSPPHNTFWWTNSRHSAVKQGTVEKTQWSTVEKAKWEKNKVEKSTVEKSQVGWSKVEKSTLEKSQVGGAQWRKAQWRKAKWRKAKWSAVTSLSPRHNTIRWTNSRRHASARKQTNFLPLLDSTSSFTCTSVWWCTYSEGACLLAGCICAFSIYPEI